MSLPLLLLGGAAWAAGGLEIVTDPNGAAILIDGVTYTGSSPTTIEGLSQGRHTVEVRRGCLAGRMEVEVLDGAIAQARIPLVTQGGMLQLQVSPPQAAVELDGAPFPVLPGVPMAIDCGEHTLRIAAPGHAPAVITVEIGAGRTTTLPVALDKAQTGWIEVDLAPAQAELYVDQRMVGRGPRRVSVEAGPHALRAHLDGYTDEERQLLVRPGESLPVAFSLEPQGAVAITRRTPDLESAARSRGREVRPDRDERRHQPWAGIALTGIGLGALGWGTAEYLMARPAYDGVLARKEYIEAGNWPVEYDSNPANWANELYNTEVLPHRQRMIVADVVGGVLVGTGLVLTFAL